MRKQHINTPQLPTPPTPWRLKMRLKGSQKTIEWMSNHMTVVLAKYAPIERSMVESSTIKTKAALGLFPEQGKDGSHG